MFFSVKHEEYITVVYKSTHDHSKYFPCMTTLACDQTTSAR